jgi:hypothetical protein
MLITLVGAIAQGTQVGSEGIIAILIGLAALATPEPSDTARAIPGGRLVRVISARPRPDLRRPERPPTLRGRRSGCSPHVGASEPTKTRIGRSTAGFTGRAGMRTSAISSLARGASRSPEPGYAARERERSGVVKARAFPDVLVAGGPRSARGRAVRARRHRRAAPEAIRRPGEIA